MSEFKQGLGCCAALHKWEKWRGCLPPEARFSCLSLFLRALISHVFRVFWQTASGAASLLFCCSGHQSSILSKALLSCGMCHGRWGVWSSSSTKLAAFGNSFLPEPAPSARDLGLVERGLSAGEPAPTKTPLLKSSFFAPTESQNLPKQPPLMLALGQASECLRLMARVGLGSCSFARVDDYLH